MHTFAGSLRLLALSALCASLGACSQCQTPADRIDHPMPELRVPSVHLVGYDEVGTPEHAWRTGVEALKQSIAIPEALETRLEPEARQQWRTVLDAFEEYHTLAESALILATTPRPTLQCSVDPQWHHPHTWTLGAHQLVQQHRNVLWALGRLELAARSFVDSLDKLREAFSADKLQHADEPLLSHLERERQNFEKLDSHASRLDGDWLHAKMVTRFARHRPALALMLRLHEALLDWRSRTETDARWSYAAGSVTGPLLAIEAWLAQSEALSDAVSEYSTESKVLERLVSAQEGSPSAECIAARVRTVSRAASSLDYCLKMQVALQRAQQGMRALLVTLGKNEETPGEILAELSATQNAVDLRVAELIGLEFAILHHWDEGNALLWQSFAEILDSEGHDTPPVLEDRVAWRAAFFAITPSKERLQAEALRLSKRGKLLTPFVSEVLDPIRSPARIAEVEQVLLAISEIDATLERMHQSIAQACGDDRCRSVPSPIVEDSPKQSQWIEGWRSIPVAERSLGHNLVILELSRLHVARQVQRLAAMHAWFAELSSASLDWPQLPHWERTWDLYAHRNGSYLNLLRAMGQIIFQVEEFARALKPERSPTLQALLEEQRRLVELSIDFARFIDREGEAPVPIDTLLFAWKRLQQRLLEIEALTLARDEKEAGNTGQAPNRQKLGE